MGRNSDDYLDSFSDKDYKGPHGLGEAMLTGVNPIAGSILRAAREKDAYHRDITKADTEKRERQRIDNAVALNTGLYFIELKKDKKLAAAGCYVSDSARALLDEGKTPTANTVQPDLSFDSLYSEKLGPTDRFTVTNCVTLDRDARASLQPIDQKLLKPVIIKKHFAFYTDYRTAMGLIMGSMALVSWDDLISFTDRKTSAVLTLDKGSREFKREQMEWDKRSFEQLRDPERFK